MRMLKDAKSPDVYLINSLTYKVCSYLPLVLVVHSEACVCVHCYSHAENHNWTFDDYARYVFPNSCAKDYARYVFRIHAPKTI